MMPLDCETVRDMLPARQRAELPSHEAARIDGHLAECAECDVVAGITGTLVRVTVPVPADLEARVLAVVGAPRRRSIPAWAGIAATVAATLVGGWLVLQWTGEPGTAGAGSVALEEAVPLMSWTVADDPLLRGGNTLQQLSVEQLELVLAEFDR
jgi:predicted anti-sigma-YlaC factor YlaD